MSGTRASAPAGLRCGVPERGPVLAGGPRLGQALGRARGGGARTEARRSDARALLRLFWNTCVPHLLKERAVPDCSGGPGTPWPGLSSGASAQST